MASGAAFSPTARPAAPLAAAGTVLSTSVATPRAWASAQLSPASQRLPPGPAPSRLRVRACACFRGRLRGPRPCACAYVWARALVSVGAAHVPARSVPSRVSLWPASLWVSALPGISVARPRVRVGALASFSSARVRARARAPPSSRPSPLSHPRRPSVSACPPPAPRGSRVLASSARSQPSCFPHSTPPPPPPLRVPLFLRPGHYFPHLTPPPRAPCHPRAPCLARWLLRLLLTAVSSCPSPTFAAQSSLPHPLRLGLLSPSASPCALPSPEGPTSACPPALLCPSSARLVPSGPPLPSPPFPPFCGAQHARALRGPWRESPVQAVSRRVTSQALCAS